MPVCELCGEPMLPGEEMFKFHGYSGVCPKPPLARHTPITKDDASKFTFAEYRKVGTTKLSNEILGVGTKVKTLEGEYVCAEPSRLAIDASGNVYPVAETVRLKSYELAGI